MSVPSRDLEVSIRSTSLDDDRHVAALVRHAVEHAIAAVDPAVEVDVTWEANGHRFTFANSLGFGADVIRLK